MSDDHRNLAVTYLKQALLAVEQGDASHALAEACRASDKLVRWLVAEPKNPPEED